MLGKLGTKKKVLDQEHQKRIEEQKNYKMETLTETLTFGTRDLARNNICTLRTYANNK